MVDGKQRPYTGRGSWVGRLGQVHRLATLSFVELRLCAQSLWQTRREVDADFVELRCTQHKGSNTPPGRVSLNKVSARMEEFRGYL